MADSNEDQPSLPLQYKTWVLEVSIHCEGCKKKVKKILTSMEDVYKVEVDAQQNKVTVTGNVDPDVLIKRLLKSGKHAQLSPEKKNAKKGNINKHEQQPKTTKPSAKKAADAKPKLDAESTGESSGAGSPSTQKEKAVGKSVPAKNGDGPKLDPEAGGDTPKLDSTSRGAPAGESDGTDAGGGDGGVEAGQSGKKKKKNKGQKGQSSESGEASEGGKVDGDGAGDAPGGCGGGYCYPVHPPAGYQPPIYSVSYHTAHPTWSYAANYAPPPPPHTYAYAATPTATSPCWETHRMFSDENPNSCFLM